MFRDALSAIWLMAGYLSLILLLGMFTQRIGKMKGIKAAPGWLGGAMWLLAVYIYFNLASRQLADPIILILVFAIVPLIYLINIAAMLLSKTYKWQQAKDKQTVMKYLFIFLGVLAVWVIGLILV